MKLQYKLWFTFSLLWLAGLAAVYLFLVDLYQKRTFENVRELAYSQAATVAERIAGMLPRFPERAEGYIDYYSAAFSARVFILDENKRTLYDSYEQYLPGTELALEVLAPGGPVPASLIKETEAFGHVQYVLYDLSDSSLAGYLLMVRDINSIYEDVRKFRERVFLFLGMALASGFAVFYAVARLFTKPIREMTLHLRNITPQNRTFPMIYKGKDEIGELVEQIRQMTQQLQVYEKRQRRFISDSSHELKTPLATMQLIAENLPQIAEDGEMLKESIHDLQSQIDKMKQIVQGMMNVYRLTDKPLQKRLIPFQDIRRHLETEFGHLAQSKRIRIEFESDGSSLYADPDLFFRGADNLVANAILYSREGKTVRISIRAANPRHTVFSVCDQGIGIDSEHLPYLFEPFYRSPGASDWNPEGSGLGLAIVKQMSDLHGGDIRVESKKGAGTCFHLTFRNNIVTKRT
jgi:signal transduction histidine kinase